MKTLFASRIGKKLKINNLLYRIQRPFVKKEIEGSDPEKSRKLLEEACPKPKGTVNYTNQIVAPEYDLQIIIPVYNAHDCIRKCIESVIDQKTKYNYICYAVNDGSKDDSGTILEEYTVNEHIRVIHQENGGLAAARNAVLKRLNANYVMFLDNDDYLPEGAIESLLDCAYENDAEIVEGSVINQIENRKVLDLKKDEVTTYKKLRGQAWSKIYKSQLFETIGFPQGYWFEDTTLSFLIYPLLKKVCTISKPVYVHTLNKQGMVEAVKGKPKSIESYWGTEYLDDERFRRDYPLDADYFIRLKEQFIINHKRIYMLDEEIKKAVFTLQREMLLKRFPNWKGSDEFMDYIFNNDYSHYCLYAYWN